MDNARVKELQVKVIEKLIIKLRVAGYTVSQVGIHTLEDLDAALDCCQIEKQI